MVVVEEGHAGGVEVVLGASQSFFFSSWLLCRCERCVQGMRGKVGTRPGRCEVGGSGQPAWLSNAGEGGEEAGGCFVKRHGSR